MYTCSHAFGEFTCVALWCFGGMLEMFLKQKVALPNHASPGPPGHMDGVNLYSFSFHTCKILFAFRKELVQKAHPSATGMLDFMSLWGYLGYSFSLKKSFPYCRAFPCVSLCFFVHNHKPLPVPSSFSTPGPNSQSLGRFVADLTSVTATPDPLLCDGDSVVHGLQRRTTQVPAVPELVIQQGRHGAHYHTEKWMLW